MGYLNELATLADHNKGTLIRMPGHKEIENNEKADELARKGSAIKFLGPEPALGIHNCIARGL